MHSNPHAPPLVTTNAIRANVNALIAKRDESLQKLAAAGLPNDIERILNDTLYRTFEPGIHALEQRFQVAEYWEGKQEATTS